jgi:hypothetical protein
MALGVSIVAISYPQNIFIKLPREHLLSLYGDCAAGVQHVLKNLGTFSTGHPFLTFPRNNAIKEKMYLKDPLNASFF